MIKPSTKPNPAVTKKPIKCISLQGIPNPEKPGICILDLGLITEYTGGGVMETESCSFYHLLDDRISVEKAKVLRGATREVLVKQGWHIVETTVIASGKKQYSIIKYGALKTLLKNRAQYIESVTALL